MPRGRGRGRQYWPPQYLRAATVTTAPPYLPQGITLPGGGNAESVAIRGAAAHPQTPPHRPPARTLPNGGSAKSVAVRGAAAHPQTPPYRTPGRTLPNGGSAAATMKILGLHAAPKAIGPDPTIALYHDPNGIW